MEKSYIEIYTKKKIKYCAGCLHTEDIKKLCSMQNYAWIFTTFFTNLYLNDELQYSWICSWCIQRLKNAKKLLENFQQAQLLLAKIAEDMESSNSEIEINFDLSNEIHEFKLKSRLWVKSKIINFSSNEIAIKNLINDIDIENEIEMKNEIPVENLINEIDIENEIEIKNEVSDCDNRDAFDVDFCDELGPRNSNFINELYNDNNRDIFEDKSIQSKTYMKQKVTTKSKGKREKSRKKKNTHNIKQIKKCNVNDLKEKHNDNQEIILTKESVKLDSHHEPSHITSDTDKFVINTTSASNIVKKNHSLVLNTSTSLIGIKDRSKIIDKRSYLPHLPRMQCPKCHCSFIKEIALINHLKRKHKKKFSCEQCDKIFPREAYLKTHIARVHEVKTGVFECAVCGKIFKHRLSIVKHVIRHEKYGQSLKEIDRIVCDHCGKICSRRNIKSHLLIHSDVKEHHCSLCGASFKVASTLENHIKRKHKDPSLEKTFACEQCGRKFYDSTQVKYHMISIHSFQGHACSVCSKCFPTKGKVREHERRVHEKVRPLKNKMCDFCDKLFSTKRMLQQHRYTHTGEKPYKCDLCTSAYNQRHCLTMHKRRAHNIDKPKTNVKLGS